MPNSRTLILKMCASLHGTVSRACLRRMMMRHPHQQRPLTLRTHQSFDPRHRKLCATAVAAHQFCLPLPLESATLSSATASACASTSKSTDLSNTHLIRRVTMHTATRRTAHQGPQQPTSKHPPPLSSRSSTAQQGHRRLCAQPVTTPSRPSHSATIWLPQPRSRMLTALTSPPPLARPRLLRCLRRRWTQLVNSTTWARSGRASTGARTTSAPSHLVSACLFKSRFAYISTLSCRYFPLFF